MAVRSTMITTKLKSLSLIGFIVATIGCFGSCDKSNVDNEQPAATPAVSNPTVSNPVVYCSVDEAFARSILEDFHQTSGIESIVVFDSEASKTTGLVNRIISESNTGRPKCDVFWSSELFNTIRLAKKGLLASYNPPTAADIPDRYKDQQHRWTAIATRARVIAYDPARISPQDLPTTWEQLKQPKFASITAIANPLFGTTRGHVAAMFALWGKDRGRDFLTQIKANGVQLVDGNSSAVRALIAGRVKLAMTDTDDVWVAQRAGYSIEMIYPDMGDGGTLLIPNSVALIKDSPHPAAAKHLIDFLVSADLEKRLAKSDSRNFPVRPALIKELGIIKPAESKIDFDAVAVAMDEAVQSVREILIR